MRPSRPVLLLPLALAACAASGPLSRAGTAGCDVVTAIRRTFAGLPCAAPSPPAPYCTRSLADVDCWRDPAALPAPLPPQVADGGWVAPQP
ncbi:MAG: hypothetical protein KGI51_01300 [Rhodospirillales bacterium]|nr:hypothetical protein [Rhodospirillales bacterium]